MGIYSVSEVTRYIKDKMDGDPLLGRVLVRGEISNFKSHYSGHCYFTLKDAAASIKSVMFKSRAQYLKFMPENGMRVVAEGHITVYERDGQYQLYASGLFPEGAGELSVAFEQLKARLAAEGLFDASHKALLPAYPKMIGVITSPVGAVLRDIVKVAKRRNPKVALRLYPVLVQGEGAARQIAGAIGFFNERYPVDALIVGRGGGSMEDLWAFNEEPVVRAIYESKIPVVSAVGHETDYTLADFAADVRAATPSQAAELTVPDAAEISRYVASLETRLRRRAERIVDEKRKRLSVSLNHRMFLNPQIALAGKKQSVDYFVEKLAAGKEAALTGKRHRLQVLLEKLEMLSPLAVVKRGYGIVKSGDTIVRRASDVAEGQRLEIVMSDAVAEAVVTGVRKERASETLRKK